MKLLIVESPAKCAKIASYLGEGWRVLASFGHIRGLKESLEALGIEKGWDPQYQNLESKQENIAKLRAQASKATEIWIGTDDDREGEAIGWHVCNLLGLAPDMTPRLVFHEVTKPALLSAVANPRRLDMNKVNASQSRSMLDMLVGFTVSPALWANVAMKLSAGRCQTPALRLVQEKETEIRNFASERKWEVCTTWCGKKASPTFTYSKELQGKDNVKLLLSHMHERGTGIVSRVTETIHTSAAPIALITSSLQQEASSQYGISPKLTMVAAQRLYEAGHITYMRTDNPSLSEEAVMAAKKQIEEQHGEEYLATSATATTKKKTTKKKVAKEESPEAVVQGAHEAVRPTHFERDVLPTEEDWTRNEKCVYGLVWRRALQSQMAPATNRVRGLEVKQEADPNTAVWKTSISIPHFRGWRIIESSEASQEAEDIAAQELWGTTAGWMEGEIVTWSALRAREKQTTPPSRYSEATLVRELEKKGIGRPSTFASIIQTLLDREYVEKKTTTGIPTPFQRITVAQPKSKMEETIENIKMGGEKDRLVISPLGKSVVEYIEKEFADIFGYGFTSTMESRLDKIAMGHEAWKLLLEDTWKVLRERVEPYISSSGRLKVAASGNSAKQRILSPEIKVIVSRKGPLILKEIAGSEKPQFASLPAGTSYETLSLQEAEAALGSMNGELLGEINDEKVVKKKGPYGFYCRVAGRSVKLEATDGLEEVKQKLGTLSTDLNGSSVIVGAPRLIGEFKIATGQYGMYICKPKLKKIEFVKWPGTEDLEKVTMADCTRIYTDGLKAKKDGAAKRSAFRKKKDE